MDDVELRRLLDGSPTLVAADFTTLARACALTGLDLSDLLGEAVAGRLALYCRVPSVSRHGWAAARSVREPDGLGCWAVPSMPPADSMPIDMGGRVLRLLDGGGDIADAALADGDVVTELVVLEHGPDSIWVPDVTIKLELAALEVLASQVESVRRRWVAGVTSERLDALRHAEAARAALPLAAVGVSGPWASKRFSEAVTIYCHVSDGLQKNLKSAKEVRQHRTTMLRLVELLGNKALGEITADDLREFRSWLRSWPADANKLGKLRRDTMKETIEVVAAEKPDWPTMSEGMVKERMVWMLRFFRWLKGKKYLSEDVAQDLKDDGDGLRKSEREALKIAKEAAAAAAGGDDEEGRVPFSAEALMALFSMPQFQTGHGRHVRKPGACYPNEYWLRLLCLWHGLRLSEGAQLWLSDVREVDGVMVLDINRLTPDKSLKNEQSKRQVPLHPELVRVGFLAWCDRLREAGFRRVFPELLWRDADERYRREPGRKMSRDLEALGYVRDGSLTFHSLRRTFNNALGRVKSSALPYEMDDRMRTFLRYTLMGHTLLKGEDPNLKHYTDITKKEYAAIVAAVEFDGMPKVTPFDLDWGLESVRSALRYHSRKPEVRGVEDCGPAT